MAPTVAIIEPHREFASALEEVVALARCAPVTMAEFDELTDLALPPAAIVVRFSTKLPFTSLHDGLSRLPSAGRPTVLALASTDADVAEAERLGCEGMSLRLLKFSGGSVDDYAICRSS
jgi:hypothetical protein